MSIIEYTGPSNPRDIRKYLMRRTKDEIIWEYLRQWREYGTLEKERDALAMDCELKRGRIYDLEQREQALAAYVQVLESIINGSDLTDRSHVMSALNSAPETSLARLKAEWQAEVLYEFTHGSYVMPAALNLAMRKRADGLYLQAKESTK